MNRLNSGIYTNLVNQTMGEVADENAYLETGPKINLYEFDIVSGFIYISERGENSITTNPANNRTNVMVQTSNEPIVCYWKDSYYSTLNEDKLSSTKHFLIGKYYEATLTSVAMTLEQSKVEWNQNDFNSFSTNKSITLVIKDKTFENIDTTKKLYLILDERAKSLQWLKVTNVVSIYDQVSENLVQNIVTLENLNLAFSTNGKDIMTFVQLAQPGGNYAFPKEVYTAVENGPPVKTVQLDPTYLFRLHGVTNTQLELNCGVGINSVFMYGRDKSLFTIKTPKRLLLLNSKVPQPSALQVIGAPATNYYAIFNAKNIMESFWEDWKNKFESYYNYLSKKVNNGGFEFNAANARLTNTINASSGQYDNSSFGTWLFSPQNGDDFEYNCKENAYIEPKLKFMTNKKYNVCSFLNMNGFIFQTQMNLPISYKETTRWELKDIPIIGSAIGGFLKLFLGFSPGWSETNTWVSGKPINFVLPCTTFEMGNTIMGGTGNKFPYDVLTNDNNQFTATGNRYQVSTINATITDRFITTNPNYIIAGAIAGKGGGGVWNTEYLTQDKDENGNSLNIVKTQSNPDGKLLWHTECIEYVPLKQNQEFEIDFIDYKVVGKCDTRLTFYTNNTLDGTLETLYETRHQTVAKFKDDGTLWDNYFIMNFMTRENSDNYFVWPENPNLPSPIDKSIEIEELRGMVWKNAISLNVSDSWKVYIDYDQKLREKYAPSCVTSLFEIKRLENGTYYGCLSTIPFWYLALKDNFLEDPEVYRDKDVSFDLKKYITVSLIDKIKTISFNLIVDNNVNNTINIKIDFENLLLNKEIEIDFFENANIDNLSFGNMQTTIGESKSYWKNNVSDRQETPEEIRDRHGVKPSLFCNVKSYYYIKNTNTFSGLGLMNSFSKLKFVIDENNVVKILFSGGTFCVSNIYGYRGGSTDLYELQYELYGSLIEYDDGSVDKRSKSFMMNQKLEKFTYEIKVFSAFINF